MYLHTPGGGHGDLLLPGESHRQRILAGFSPYGCQESDMTHIYIYIYTHTIIFFTHSSVHGLVSCFHVLAVVSSATINTGVRVSF